MSLKGIISISGMPGLYKVLAQTKTGFIVESMSDKKRMPVSSTQRISMLEEISVFTTADDLPLKEVLLKMRELEESKPPVDPKDDPEKLKGYFKKIVPEYDTERVYTSDIKKILTWFQLVKDIVAIEDETEKQEESESQSSEEEETVSAENDADSSEKPAKKTAAKKKTGTAAEKETAAGSSKSRSKKESK